MSARRDGRSLRYVREDSRPPRPGSKTMQSELGEYLGGTRDGRDREEWVSVYVKGGEGRGFRERRERVSGGAMGWITASARAKPGDSVVRRRRLEEGGE